MGAGFFFAATFAGVPAPLSPLAAGGAAAAGVPAGSGGGLAAFVDSAGAAAACAGFVVSFFFPIRTIMVSPNGSRNCPGPKRG